MSPTERFGDRTARPGRLIEPAEATIGVGLQDPAVIGQVPLGVLAAAIARVAEEDGRHALAEGAVIANIGPQSAGDRLVLGEHRHGRVVTMQPFGGEHVLADQLV